jgi:hypothetical protein
MSTALHQSHSRVDNPLDTSGHEHLWYGRHCGARAMGTAKLQPRAGGATRPRRGMAQTGATFDKRLDTAVGVCKHGSLTGHSSACEARAASFIGVSDARAAVGTCARLGMHAWQRRWLLAWGWHHRWDRQAGQAFNL